MNGEQAYEYALAQIQPDADGGINEEALAILIASSIDFDEEKARLGLAQRVIARRKRPGQTTPEGQLILPGMGPYAYEPNRLIADDKGRVVQNAKAGPDFKRSDDRRAQDDLDKAQRRARRVHEEFALFSEWALDQVSKGRPRNEITWDTCIHETHLWKDADPEPEDVALEEDSLP